jgi:hypothetical protein
MNFTLRGMVVTVNTFTDTLVSLIKATAVPAVDLLVSSVPVLLPLKGLFESGAEKVVDLVVSSFVGTTITDSNI